MEADLVASPELPTRLRGIWYSWSDFQAAQRIKKVPWAKRSDKVQRAVDAFLLNHQSFNATEKYWMYRDGMSYEKRSTEITGIPLALQDVLKRVWTSRRSQGTSVTEILKYPTIYISIFWKMLKWEKLISCHWLTCFCVKTDKWERYCHTIPGEKEI